MVGTPISHILGSPTGIKIHMKDRHGVLLGDPTANRERKSSHGPSDTIRNIVARDTDIGQYPGHRKGRIYGP